MEGGGGGGGGWRSARKAETEGETDRQVGRLSSRDRHKETDAPTSKVKKKKVIKRSQGREGKASDIRLEIFKRADTRREREGGRGGREGGGARKSV